MRPLGGEPVQYKVGDSYWKVCCDCCLSHLVFHRIKNNKVIEMAYRDDYDTQYRRTKMSTFDIKQTIKELQKELRRRKKNGMESK